MNFKNIFNKKAATVIILIIFMMLLPRPVTANTAGGNRNLYFVQLLNYTVPLIKVTSFNEEDMAENSFSISEQILNLTGVNLKSPLAVLGKEVSYLGAINSNYDSNNYDLKYFTLEDEQIAKGDGTASTEINNVNVVNPDIKKTLNTAKPEVLIYHTHTTESYKPGAASNFDNTQNVVAVGDELVAELQNNYGISAINDKTVHDAQAYTQSYARSSVTVDNYIKKYGDFKIIIDLHRDSVSNKNAVTAKINGENVAKIMLVMAKKNPHFDKNMALANKIIQNSNKLFPGFCKGVCYYNYGTRYFNQDKSNNAILVEVGADINTSSEAKASAKYMARLIAESIK